jgi:ABC-2 type transport system permease protein
MSGEAGLELREVRGPSALGGGGRRFFELLYLVSVTEFKKTYFGTVLGYVWSLMRPLMLFAVLLFVFTRIFRVGAGIPYYSSFLLFNIVLFTFFSEATSAAVSSVVNQEGIVRKTQFPRLVIPMATVMTAFFNLSVNLIAVFIFILALGVQPTATWLLLPVILALLFVFSSAVSLILSTLYVRFRDVGIIWGVLATALFYATPVLYPLSIVPQYSKLLMINPLTPIFVQTRTWIIDRSAPGALATAGGWLHLIAPIAIYVATCVFAVWIFNREAPRVAEEL